MVQTTVFYRSSNRNMDNQTLRRLSGNFPEIVANALNSAKEDGGKCVRLEPSDVSVRFFGSGSWDANVKDLDITVRLDPDIIGPKNPERFKEGIRIGILKLFESSGSHIYPPLLCVVQMLCESDASREFYF